MTRALHVGTAASAILSLLFSACAMAADISGSWTATEVGGQPASGSSVAFEGNRVSASAGCNRIAGPAEIKGSTIKLGPLMATRMFCEGKMEAEQALSSALEQARSFSLDGGVLVLKGDGGAVTARFKR
jgi:heat shock protein HslJ